MTEPLPLGFWEAVRALAEPDELVKFTLIYDGDLPSSGNKSKPIEASNIRNAFHDQLADLWDSHVIFRQMARTARTYPHLTFWSSEEYPPPGLPDYKEQIQPLQPGQTDYCAPIPVSAAGVSYVPIVRNSLYLAAAVDILFLRHEEPLSLMRQGRDLDGRLKTLFDALKMPDPKEPIYKGADPMADPLYVVLEDDSLISDVSIKSGRLLGRGEKKKHQVRLTVDVTIKVLRVFQQNQCLVGG
jgi:hypothetical protein